MQNRAIFLESNRLEQQLINFQLEGALLEVMKNDLMARSIIAEHRKIEKYALQLGLVNKRQLNEGLGMDIALGAGQMLGSIGSYFGFPLGLVFGAAGVIWDGKEMLAAEAGSFDFFMNLIFALFSAAACEPTGAAATATNTSKLFTPFIKLGNAARALGNGVLDAGKALAFVKKGGTATSLAVKAASTAEPTVVAAFPILDRIVAGATGLLQRVTPQIQKIPGAGIFNTISKTIVKWGAKAWAFIKECLTSLFNVAKTAAGKALGTTAAADASLAAARAGGRATAATTTMHAAVGTYSSAVLGATAQLGRLAATKSGGALSKLIANTPGGAQGVLAALARNEPSALKAFASATKQVPGVLPAYLKNGIAALKGAGARMTQTATRGAAAGATANAANIAAQKAAATAAARVAAAKIGAQRLGAGAVKAAGSSQTQ